MSDTIQIYAAHFCAGVIHDDGRIVKAAPIVRYMLGWSGKEFNTYCARKGWTYQHVPQVTA